MVGRELSAVFPKIAGRRPARWCSRLAGLGCRGAGVRDVSPAGAGRRDPGARRLGRRGAHRAGAGDLFGLTPADSGELLLRGRAVTIDSPAARRSRLGSAMFPKTGAAMA